MTDLTLAADAAYPFDYGILSPGVSVILGYVGQEGCTPHVWTRSEIDAATATGRAWHPIWTPPQGSFDGAAGGIAASSMVGVMRALGLPASGPVFLDIEKATFDGSPDAVRAGIIAWQNIMHAAGHAYAVPYLPADAGYGWQANWTGVQPESLPAGLTGVQYAGRLDGDRYDLSVFNPSVFASTAVPTPPFTHPAPPPVVHPAPAPEPGTYVVRAGDTLSGIAATHGTTWQALATLNHLSNPNLIYPGQELQLGTVGNPARTYRVQPGDTLYAIAAREGTTWEHLATLNHLAHPNLIYPDQLLAL